jgi:CRISPR-associated protein Cmr6
MTEQSTSRRTVLQKLHIPPPVQNTPSTRSEQAPGAINPTKGVHAGLWLDKYLTNGDKGQSGSQKKQEPGRQTLVREVASLEVPALYTTFYQRWQQTLNEAGAINRKFEVKGRMAVGLGNEGVLETSVALHHTYGVPYIPGSALKGLAASYARLMAGEDWQPGRPAYRTVFGDTENAGYIIFFDALYVPESAPPVPATPGDHPLRADIITVHHPSYYKGIAPPADWDSPNPVPFLSTTGKYLIALAAPDLDNGEGYRDLWIEKVFEILTEALLVMGIGAKTSSGYGRMHKVDLPAQPAHPEVRVAEGYKREIEAVKDIPSQMNGYYQQWKRLKTDEGRKIVALAIVERIAETHQEKWASGRSWYQELQAFLEPPSPDM